MFELLMAFAFWPWFLLSALLIGLFLSATSEMTFIAVVSLIIYGAISFLALGVNPMAWIVENPGGALLVAGLYACLGIAWSLFKWSQHLASEDIQQVLKQSRDRFKKNGSMDAVDFRNSIDFPNSATAAHNKSRIVNWIALWPFSVFLFLTYDLLSKAFNGIYEMISDVYESMTNRYIP